MDRRGSRGTENWKTGNYEWREVYGWGEGRRLMQWKRMR